MKALIMITVVIYIGTFVKKIVHVTCNGYNTMFGSFHHCYDHYIKFFQSYSSVFIFL